MDQSQSQEPNQKRESADAGRASRRTWTEEIEVAGGELLAAVKRLAAEGRVSRVRLVDPDGDIVLEMPLTIGAIAGGAVVLAAPLVAVLGALAAFVTKVRLEVVRVGDKPDDTSTPGGSPQ